MKISPTWNDPRQAALMEMQRVQVQRANTPWWRFIKRRVLAREIDRLFLLAVL